MASTYRIEPNGPWSPRWREKDVVVAKTDEDALRQARQRCRAGALFRYSSADRARFPLVYVAPFFSWEVRLPPL